MARRWTTTEDRLLRRLYPQLVPIREIATELGRSEDAVSERRRALRLPARPRQRPWSPAEDQLLRAVATAGLPAAALASRLARDAEQIRRRRRTLLGAAAAAPRAYMPADDDAIRASWEGDLDLGRLAGDLGRSPGSIRLRAVKLGLHRPARRRRWHAYEDAAARDGYERGLSCEQIATELTGRTTSAVAARAAKLGLATYARKWTASDDHALRILTFHGAELERATQLLARTPDALRARARKLGLTPLRSRRSDQRPRRWTAGEDEQLRLHQGLNPGALAELLGRSPEAVAQRLRRLNVREARQRSPHHPASVRGGFTPGERATLARELQTGAPRRELALAQRLGRTPAEIRAVARHSAPSGTITRAAARPAVIAADDPTGRPRDAKKHVVAGTEEQSSRDDQQSPCGSRSLPRAC
jgi:hypothetical protein